MKITAVIPAYNEAQTIGQVVQEVKVYVDEVIVVDDGSSDETADIAGGQGAQIYRHILNRGLGASLSTGIKAALKRAAEVVITFDADGQHQASDIPKLIEAIRKEGAEIVLGERMSIKGQMPYHRLIYNRLANLVTFILFGLWVSDTQSGLRAFSRQAVEKIVLKTRGMEVSSEIVSEIKRHNLILKEVPIEVLYSSYSLHKGQSFMKGLKTLFYLLLRRVVK